MALPPSAVRVEVLSAKDLAHKGKTAFNAFVTMQLSNGGKKFGTETISHSSNPAWDEECRLPVSGMDADLLLTVQHRGKLGLDEFIGMLVIPLSRISSMSSWAQWMELEGRHGNKDKKRGSIKVKINFIYDMNATPQTLSKPSSSSSVRGSSPNPTHRLSTKAKSVVKGISGALHHGRDKSPATQHKQYEDDTHLQVPGTPNKKLSIDDVMQDLQLDDSMELEQESDKVIVRSATYDTAGDATEESSGSSWSKRSLKMRRRLSLPSVSQHGGSSSTRSSVTAINEDNEPTGQEVLTASMDSTSHPTGESSPATHVKHKRLNTIAHNWLNRSRASSDSAATEEELIAHGQFSALSKQALIRLATRQQEELGEKQDELTNLRGYIDAVLMRVIEHNPDLLNNLSTPSRSQEQRDGGSYYSRRPLARGSHPNDSGCGSGSASPDHLGSSDGRQVRHQRSSSSPGVHHVRRLSLVSTSSSDGKDGKDLSLPASFSGSLSAGQELPSHHRTGSSTSSLMESGSLTKLPPSGKTSPAASTQDLHQSARFRPM